MDLKNPMVIAASGMRAQGVRLRVIAHNIANAGSTAPAPGEDPYRRQVLTFKNELDRASGVEQVKVDRIRTDMSPFRTTFDPGHPSADENGYVRLPNVNGIIETVDMREAQRSYEANVNVVDVTKNMLARTVDLLRG